MRTLLLTICAAALGTASCITIATPAPVDETPQFVTATLRSTKTPYASPTVHVTASTSTSPTAAVTVPANCKDAALLLQDVTISDGTNVPYGSKFTKTWQFKNDGQCPWQGYSIAFVSGDRMGAPDSEPVIDTAPKSTVNVSVDLVAPTTDGVYTGVFELRNSLGKALSIGIEKSFWVKIAVGSATVPTLPVASGAIPTITGTLTTPHAPLSCKYVVSGSYPGEIANLINQARAGAGLPALTVNAQLTSAAQAHSIDMACFGFYGHNGSDGSTIQQRIAAAGYPATFSEEMVYASGYPQAAFDWWMNDPVHHDIIFDTRIRDIGVGYAYVSDSAYGGYYTVDVGSQ
ncbi:MAG: NBR1-Ig-like domain-containing protein [Anaerolineales bacterium]